MNLVKAWKENQKERRDSLQGSMGGLLFWRTVCEFFSGGRAVCAFFYSGGLSVRPFQEGGLLFTKSDQEKESESYLLLRDYEISCIY